MLVALDEDVGVGVVDVEGIDAVDAGVGVIVGEGVGVEDVEGSVASYATTPTTRITMTIMAAAMYQLLLLSPFFGEPTSAFFVVSSAFLGTPNCLGLR